MLRVVSRHQSFSEATINSLEDEYIYLLNARTTPVLARLKEFRTLRLPNIRLLMISEGGDS